MSDFLFRGRQLDFDLLKHDDGNISQFGRNARGLFHLLIVIVILLLISSRIGQEEIKIMSKIRIRSRMRCAAKVGRAIFGER
jgi:hypothetical protein